MEDARFLVPLFLTFNKALHFLCLLLDASLTFLFLTLIAHRAQLRLFMFNTLYELLNLFTHNKIEYECLAQSKIQTLTKNG